ncbi:SDR family NAD(P)-dependent oxidoreductase [Thermoflexibacter ruber]|uniref:NAD(P)-dependent dehydrogenase, short-chain alcohol dehydrogenase family n=1 Tax=Thermoflexibacter ruber TaxID=1003 RepID=A0A1I2EU80_9BACT|nr:SDR family oxidoreductase [Thermoflexibacter ruber]SFE96694.1 NAD(P)-dependent dehydrogenase, short-chain alcohol dehydrogenase family [Thermoflexibacter ruber]
MHINLTGQHILVTGASRGIGKAIALKLIETGAKVAIHYSQHQQSAQEIVKAYPEHAVAFQADLANPQEVVGLFEAVIKAFGKLDVLVNNAGIAISSAMTKDDQLWLKDWELTMAVNLSATGLLCKKSITHFLTHQSGRIINITSRAAFRGDTAEYIAYAASKGGMVALTRSIARAYGKQGIKAFNIAPGFTRTDMARSFIDQYGELYAMNDIALDRLTEPEDIAPLVVFLASGWADHATGATIDINAASYVH